MLALGIALVVIALFSPMTVPTLILGLLGIGALGFYAGSKVGGRQPMEKLTFNQMTAEQRQKARFVGDLNLALFENGIERYEYLNETPLTYEVIGSEEFVRCGKVRVCVTGDSLAAIMSDVARWIF